MKWILLNNSTGSYSVQKDPNRLPSATKPSIAIGAAPPDARGDTRK